MEELRERNRTIPGIEFQRFPKIARLFNPIVITEKLDGTNAQVLVTEGGQVLAGSRRRFLTLDHDNYGFAAWVKGHAKELLELGPGRHYGEWWGQGIQRNYDLKEKRFSLFNVKKWADEENRPACCHVVPVLATMGTFHTDDIRLVMHLLARQGSHAAPGFMHPEGIMVYHPQANVLFKSTYDDTHKGEES